MRKPEGYNRLWKNKMDELPLQTDQDKAWAEMQSFLDKQMPAGTNQPEADASSPAGPLGAGYQQGLVKKLLSALQYVLPAAAMVGTGIYFTAQQDVKVKGKEEKIDKVKTTDTLKNERPNADTAQNNHIRFDQRNIVPLQELSSIPERVDENTDMHASANINAPATMPLSKNIQAAEQPASMPDKKAAAPGQQIPVPDQAASVKGMDQAQADKGNDSAPTKKQRLRSKTGINWDWLDALFIGKETGWGTRGKDIIEEQRGMGLVAVSNLSPEGATVFPGIYAQLPLKNRLGLYSEINVLNRLDINGSYRHPSFTRPDSMSFDIADTRKLHKAEIPLHLTYKLSNSLKIQGGPVLGYVYRQTEISNTISPIENPRDTLFKQQYIKKSLAESSITNRFTVGISGGITFQYRRLNIGSVYMLPLKPYSIRTDLGTYGYGQGNFQLRIGLKIDSWKD